MYHILVADDEQKVREMLVAYGEYAGYAVSQAKDGDEVLELCSKEAFDLLILDVMMPRQDGFSVCMELRRRKETVQLPIIFLSARGEEYDRIYGFQLGADDYVVKPFSPKELMLRVDAVIRRSKGVQYDADCYRYRGLQVAFSACRVEVDGTSVRLSPKEFELLEYLIRNRNMALSRSQLLQAVWGEDYYGDARTLDTHIKKLRQALGAYGRMIVTVRGIGYRLDAE